MRKSITICICVMVAFMVIGIAVSGVNAQENNPWVATFKEDGTPCDVFLSGEKVWIKAYSQNPLPYQIIVKDPDGNTRLTRTSYTASYEEVVSGITDVHGWWVVQAGSAETHYATAWYQVIPEVPFGTLAILLSMFGAIGIFAIKRKNGFSIGMPQ